MLTSKSGARFCDVVMNNPANVYLFKVNNRNTRKRCEIGSKLTIKISERLHWRCSDVFIVNFEHISNFFEVFLLSTLNKYMLVGKLPNTSLGQTMS